MITCWQHDAQSRPKFEQLQTRLARAQPKQLTATIDATFGDESTGFLQYRKSDVITVLDDKYERILNALILSLALSTRD